MVDLKWDIFCPAVFAGEPSPLFAFEFCFFGKSMFRESCHSPHLLSTPFNISKDEVGCLLDQIGAKSSPPYYSEVVSSSLVLQSAVHPPPCLISCLLSWNAVQVIVTMSIGCRLYGVASPLLLGSPFFKRLRACATNVSCLSTNRY